MFKWFPHSSLIRYWSFPSFKIFLLIFHRFFKYLQGWHDAHIKWRKHTEQLELCNTLRVFSFSIGFVDGVKDTYSHQSSEPKKNQKYSAHQKSSVTQRLFKVDDHGILISLHFESMASMTGRRISVMLILLCVVLMFYW